MRRTAAVSSLVPGDLRRLRHTRGRSAGWLLVTALAIELLASWTGHGCLPLDAAPAAEQLAEQLPPDLHPERGCPACALQLQSRAAACDSPSASLASPDPQALIGRPADDPRSGSGTLRPPSRAPPLLG